MANQDNKPVVENVQAKPDTELVKVLKRLARLLNPMPRPRAWGWPR